MEPFNWQPPRFHRANSYLQSTWQGHRLTVKRSIGGGFTAKINGGFIANKPTMVEALQFAERAAQTLLARR